VSGDDRFLPSLSSLHSLYGDKLRFGIPYYGIGVFHADHDDGLCHSPAICLSTFPKGTKRAWGAFGAGFAAILSGLVFVGQIAAKWTEGGWVVLISFSILIVTANLVLISPIGISGNPSKSTGIVRQKARVQGAMASIVEWQSLRMQEYRYNVIVWIARFFEMLGVRPTNALRAAHPGRRL